MSSAHTEITRRKIPKEFLENAGTLTSGRQPVTHSQYAQERPTRPQHGDTHGGLNTHIHCQAHVQRNEAVERAPHNDHWP